MKRTLDRRVSASLPFGAACLEVQGYRDSSEDWNGFPIVYAANEITNELIDLGVPGTPLPRSVRIPTSNPRVFLLLLEVVRFDGYCWEIDSETQLPSPVEIEIHDAIALEPIAR